MSYRGSYKDAIIAGRLNMELAAAGRFVKANSKTKARYNSPPVLGKYRGFVCFKGASLHKFGFFILYIFITVRPMIF